MNDIIKLTYQPEGEEIKKMGFDEKGNLDVEGKGMLQLQHKDWEYRIIEWESGESEDITNKVNPLYLEFITQEECNQCAGSGMYDYDSYKKPRKCMACTDGKVEVSTGFYSFIGKDEYDEALTKKGETRYRYYECYECHDSFKIDSNRMGEVIDKDYTVCKNCLKKAELNEK